jgi:hypothetical protein
MRIIIIIKINWEQVMRNIFNRIRQLRQRYVSSKAIAIWALNKKLPEGWGHIIDLDLDRELSLLSIQICTSKREPLNRTQLSIAGYQINTESSESRLTWTEIKVKGHNKSWFKKQLMQRKFIVIPAHYVALVEKLDKRQQLTRLATQPNTY